MHLNFNTWRCRIAPVVQKDLQAAAKQETDFKAKLEAAEKQLQEAESKLTAAEKDTAETRTNLDLVYY